MLKLNPMEIKALNTLWKSSKGLDAFSFFRRLNVSFTDYSRITRLLCDKALIKETTNDFFVITTEGITYISQKRIQQREQPWRTVPNKFLSAKISTSEFYVPSLYLLDKKTFNVC